MSRLFGLIGYPLSHSFSKKYFSEKFQELQLEDHVYELFPLQHIEELPNLIKSHPNLTGLNVTIPYKQDVIPFLNELDSAAKEIGAVNTINFGQSGLKGYNTDVYGFELSLKETLSRFDGTKVEKALVFGTGGAAKAVEFVLRKLEIEFLLVSRSASKGHLTYDEIDKEILSEYSLLINTTPLGMSPNIDSAPPIPYDDLSRSNILFDLVYNPEKTLFLKEGERHGCLIKNGLEMLHLQAEKAWEIWNA